MAGIISDTDRYIYRLSRPRNAVNPALAVLLGAVFSGSPGYISQAPTSIAVVSIVLLNFAFTLQNDLVDKQLDQAGGRKTPLTTGRVSDSQVVTAIRVMQIVALGLPVVSQIPEQLVFTVPYAVLGWQYNMRPIQASRRPLLSIAFLAVLLSALPFWFGAYLAGDVRNGLVGIALVGWALYRSSTSVLKDYKDAAADSSFAKRTFLLAYGPQLTRWSSIIWGVIGAVAILSVSMFGRFRTSSYIAVGLLWLVFVAATVLRLRLSNDKKAFAHNNELFHRILNVQLIFEFGLLLWFCIF